MADKIEIAQASTNETIEAENQTNDEIQVSQTESDANAPIENTAQQAADEPTQIPSEASPLLQETRLSQESIQPSDNGLSSLSNSSNNASAETLSLNVSSVLRGDSGNLITEQVQNSNAAYSTHNVISDNTALPRDSGNIADLADHQNKISRDQDDDIDVDAGDNEPDANKLEEIIGRYYGSLDATQACADTGFLNPQNSVDQLLDTLIESLDQNQGDQNTRENEADDDTPAPAEETSTEDGPPSAQTIFECISEAFVETCDISLNSASGSDQISLIVEATTGPTTGSNALSNINANINSGNGEDTVTVCFDASNATGHTNNICADISTGDASSTDKDIVNLKVNAGNSSQLDTGTFNLAMGGGDNELDFDVDASGISNLLGTFESGAGADTVCFDFNSNSQAITSNDFSVDLGDGDNSYTVSDSAIGYCLNRFTFEAGSGTDQVTHTVNAGNASANNNTFDTDLGDGTNTQTLCVTADGGMNTNTFTSDGGADNDTVCVDLNAGTSLFHDAQFGQRLGNGENTANLKVAACEITSPTLSMTGGTGNDTIGLDLDTSTAGVCSANLNYNVGDGDNTMTATSDSVGYCLNRFTFESGSGTDQVTHTVNAGNASANNNTFDTDLGDGTNTQTLCVTADGGMDSNTFTSDGGADNDTVCVDLNAGTSLFHNAQFGQRLGNGENTANLKVAACEITSPTLSMTGGTGNDTIGLDLDASTAGVCSANLNYNVGDGDNTMTATSDGVGYCLNRFTFEAGSGTDQVTHTVNAGNASADNNTFDTDLGDGTNTQTLCVTADGGMNTNTFTSDGGEGNDAVCVDLNAGTSLFHNAQFGQRLGNGENTANLKIAACEITSPTLSMTGGTGNDTIGLDLDASTAGVCSANLNYNVGDGDNTMTATSDSVGYCLNRFTFEAGSGIDQVTHTVNAGNASADNNTFDTDLGSGTNTQNLCVCSRGMDCNTFAATGAEGNDTVCVDLNAQTGIFNKGTFTQNIGDGENTSVIKIAGSSLTTPDTTVNSGSGDDTITLDLDASSGHLCAGTFEYDMGAGDNTATLTSDTVGYCHNFSSFEGEGGDDSVTQTINAGSAAAVSNSICTDLGSGDNTHTLCMNSVHMNANTFAATGAEGNDTVCMELDTGNGTFNGNQLRTNLGNGDNTVNVDACGSQLLSQDATFIGGTSADTLTIDLDATSSCANSNTLAFDLGDGANNLTLTSDSTGYCNNNLTHTGGAGNDTICETINAGNGSANTNSFSYEMGDGTNCIDLDFNAKGVCNNTYSYASSSGDDKVQFDWNIGTCKTCMEDIDVNLGEGTNSFTGNVTAHSVGRHDYDFTGGTGDDTVALNFDNVTCAVCCSTFDFNLGNGNNTITVDADVNCVCDNKFTVIGGTGTDTITFDLDGQSESVLRNCYSITGGAGNDTLTIDLNAGQRIESEKVNVNLGEDNNAFTWNVTANSWFARNNMTYVGGAGNDAVTLDIESTTSLFDCLHSDITLGNGDNTVTSNFTAGDKICQTCTTIVAGTGDDTVCLTYDGGTTGAAQTNVIDVNVGNGTNLFHLVQDGCYNGANVTTYTGGTGQDTVCLELGKEARVVENEDYTINLGNGTNSLGVVADSACLSLLDFNINGGNDADTVDILLEASDNQHRWSNYNTNLGDGTNCFDLCLSGDDLKDTKFTYTGGSGVDEITTEFKGLKAGGCMINNDFVFNLGDGANTLTHKLCGDHLHGSNHHSVTGGSGTDTVCLDLVSAGNKLGVSSTNIALGGGNNTIELNVDIDGGSMLSSCFTTTGGSGDDTITETFAVTNGYVCRATLHNTLGDGTNSLTIDMDAQSICYSTFSITGGTGDDTVLIDLNTTSGHICDNTYTVSTGAGNDTITVDLKAQDRVYRETINIDAGDDNNTFTLNACDCVWLSYNTISYTGGTGNDTVNLDFDSTDGAFSYNNFTLNLADGTNIVTGTINSKCCISNQTFDFNGGTGNDTVCLTLTGDNTTGTHTNTFDFAASDGNNLFHLNTAGCYLGNNNLTYTGGTGNDTICILQNAGATGRLGGDTHTVDLGEGTNALTINNTAQSAGSLTLDLTGGNNADTVDIEMNGTAGNGYYSFTNLDIDLEDGTNCFNLTQTGGQRFDRNNYTYTGGDGIDELRINFEVGAGTRTNYNNSFCYNLGNGTNLVDHTFKSQSYGCCADIDITSGTGNDTICLKIDSTAGCLHKSSTTLNLGDGNNTINLDLNAHSGSTCANVFNTTTGNGNDTLTVDVCADQTGFCASCFTDTLGNGTNAATYNIDANCVTYMDFTATGGAGEDTLCYTLNGKSGPLCDNDFDLQTLAGNDTICLTLTAAGTNEIRNNRINVDLGNDTNSFGLSANASSHIINNTTSVTGGTGTDTINIVLDGQANFNACNSTHINLSDGANTATIEYASACCVCSNSMTYTGGSGTDTVTLKYTADAANGQTLNNTYDVNLGNGTNSFTLDSTGGWFNRGNSGTVTGGNGNDTICYDIDSTATNFNIYPQTYTANLGDGNNTVCLDLDAHCIGSQTLCVTTGSGNDFVSSTLTSGAPCISDYNNHIALGDGTNCTVLTMDEATCYVQNSSATISGGSGDDTVCLDFANENALCFRNINVELSLGDGDNTADICFDGQCHRQNTVTYTGGSGTDTVTVDLGGDYLYQDVVCIDTGAGADTITIKTEFPENCSASWNCFYITGGEGADNIVFRDFDAPTQTNSFWSNCIDLIYDSAASFGDQITGGTTFLCNDLFNFKFNSANLLGNNGGSVNTNSFVSGDGAVALDADDYWIFDTATDTLYYDADGNGSNSAVAVADFTATDVELTAGDIQFT